MAHSSSSTREISQARGHDIWEFCRSIPRIIHVTNNQKRSSQLKRLLSRVCLRETFTNFLKFVNNPASPKSRRPFEQVGKPFTLNVVGCKTEKCTRLVWVALASGYIVEVSSITHFHNIITGWFRGMCSAAHIHYPSVLLR